MFIFYLKNKHQQLIFFENISKINLKAITNCKKGTLILIIH